MINPHIRNRRTGCHEDICHRNHHYLNVLNSKSHLDNKINQRFFPKRNKYALDPNTSIAQQNLHLYKRLISLERSPPRYIILGKEPPQAIVHKKKNKKLFMKMQKHTQITEDNVRLLRKIESVKSNLSLKKGRRTDSQKKSESFIEAHMRNLTQMEDECYATFQREMFRTTVKSRERREVSSSAAKRERLERFHVNRKRVRTVTGTYSPE